MSSQSTVAESLRLKFVADAKDLAECVGIAASVAPAKATRPVLQSVLLRAEDGVVEVTGSDMEVAVRVRFEQVEVGQDGALLLNAARFQQILRELAGERVEITANERGVCTISTGDASFQIMGEEAEAYPEQAPWPAEGVFRLGAKELVGMIRRTHFAAHPEKTRYAMNGILLDLRERRLHLVATDGKRLALCERELPEEVAAPVHVVVPTKGMNLLPRVLEEGDAFVEIAVGPAQVFFRTPKALVTARLVEGHFPPYEEVLPKGHDKVLTLPRESFLCALRRASILGTKDSQSVRFAFDREGLELTARVPEVGASRVRFPLDYPFDPLSVGFNPAFFVDVLKVLATPEVRLELKDPKSPAVIREGSDDGWSFVYLVMPLNLEG